MAISMRKKRKEELKGVRKEIRARKKDWRNYKRSGEMERVSDAIETDRYRGIKTSGAFMDKKTNRPVMGSQRAKDIASGKSKKEDYEFLEPSHKRKTWKGGVKRQFKEEKKRDVKALRLKKKEIKKRY